MPSSAVEDYLKTMYDMEHVGEKVTTSALAARLGIQPASVTGMIKRLGDMAQRVAKANIGASPCPPAARATIAACSAPATAAAWAGPASSACMPCTTWASEMASA